MRTRGCLSSCDESGFDLRCRTVYGYAKKGDRAILNVPRITRVGRHSDRLHSLVMAMHMDGTCHHQVVLGSVNGNIFSQFIATAPFPPGTVVLLDNHSMHKTAAVRAEAARLGYTLLFTPPYSPEFNPIELMFGSIKGEFYKLRYTPAGLNNVGVGVETCVSETVDPLAVGKCFRHVSQIIDGVKRF